MTNKERSDFWEILNTLSVYNDVKKFDMKSTIWSVCLSETELNETLWLKYANNHKGFVVEYSLSNENLYLCGKKDKCLRCPLLNMQTSLYPMYYSDEKYDATKYAIFYLICDILLKDNTVKSLKYLDDLISSGLCMWESEKVTLIKRKCHEYDMEWRIILPYRAVKTEKPFIKWIPSSVILGLNISDSEQSLVINIARNAGISTVKKVIIDNKSNLKTIDI